LTRKDIPNLISIIRIALIFPIIWAIVEGRFSLALVIFAIAGVSDALDGFLAKQYHWQSRLGTILDPIADKLLLVASFATLAWLNLLPMWLFLLVMARDLMIVIGGMAYHYIVGKFELLPLWSSKVNTAFQIVLVLLVILQQIWSQIDPLVVLGGWLVVASVIYSGSEYILVWGLRAWQQMKK